jgi:hypothetical protein
MPRRRMHQGAGGALLFTHSNRYDDHDPDASPAHDSSQEVDDMTDDHKNHLDLVVCPECAAPAEVVDRFALPSTHGPVEHVKLQCLGRHWFLLPASSLAPVHTPSTATTTGPVR